MCSVDNPYRQIWKRSISRSLLNSLCSDFRTKSMWGERGWGPLRYKTSYSRRLLLLQRKKAPRIEDGRQIASFRQKIKRTNAALTPPSADRMFGGAAGARIFWALKRLCCAARPSARPWHGASSASAFFFPSATPYHLCSALCWRQEGIEMTSWNLTNTTWKFPIGASGISRA